MKTENMFKKFMLGKLLLLSTFGLYAQNIDSLSSVQTIKEFINSTKSDKKKIEKKILNQNPNFNLVYENLKQGKQYLSNCKTGFIEYIFKASDGIEHPNLIFIPYNYNPQKKYQVKFVLHGAISSPDKYQIFKRVDRTDTSWNSVNKIYLYPSAWDQSMWWDNGQFENISNLLAFVKENYNVDENDIYLYGISDGATGLYYFSNVFSTPFSCYLPFIGNMETLPLFTSKQLYLKNYQGLSFFIVNCRKDEIFDIRFIIPTIKELKKVAKEVNFFIVDSSKHRLNWFPVLKDTINYFINNHKRNPFPDKIYFATEQPDSFCRKFWVKIDRIGKTKSGMIKDLNNIVLNQDSVILFSRKKLFGQIEVNKLENTVKVITQNVKKYSLLISPDHFDVSKPIQVYTNGILSYEGIVNKDIKTLLKYNIEDNDRTMLFTSELEIIVGKPFKK